MYASGARQTTVRMSSSGVTLLERSIEKGHNSMTNVQDCLQEVIAKGPGYMIHSSVRAAPSAYLIGIRPPSSPISSRSRLGCSWITPGRNGPPSPMAASRAPSCTVYAATRHESALSSATALCEPSSRGIPNRLSEATPYSPKGSPLASNPWQASRDGCASRRAHRATEDYWEHFKEEP